MWIDSLRGSRSQPLRMKWPEDHDTNLLYSANSKCEKKSKYKACKHIIWPRGFHLQESDAHQIGALS